MDIASLEKRFGIPGVLSFDQDHGLNRLLVKTATVEATLYLQGAHLTHWKPVCQDAMLFVSRQSQFAEGKPIRGGVPVVFPWFATDSKKDRVDGHPGPSHGFARLQEWELVEAKRAGEEMHLKLTLGPTAMSRSMGYDAFQLTLEIALGKTLEMRLHVKNTGSGPLQFEEAFHTYYWIVDVHEATVYGLEGTPYIDKMDNFKEKAATGQPIRFTAPTDRVYLNTETPLRIHDGVQGREIRIVKTNSHNTTVWNPGKPMDPDVGEWDWHEFCCVETVNAGANARTLAPGEEFVMGQRVSVERTAPGCASRG